ncbi:SIR2 family protein [Sphaerochaeta sp. S2]|uniref:SIR2 family protein n=1 Tax=Sphaerochaeta sp. S2 TaxID=2798868 RepID=UPI0018EA294A|nr:SIR2 family protein [Sphaerochaeta sp. S2]MBJ2355446.1 SIR2 family protein [Sphaerochaeta sp. S2]
MEKDYEISWRLSQDNKWVSISVKNSENDPERNQEEKDILKRFLLSSMQMQNIVVLAGSGTSMSGKDGPKMGPSMSDLWELCTKEGDSYSSEAKEVFGTVRYKYEEKQNFEELLSLCEAVLQIDNDNTGIVKKFVSNSKERILKRCNYKKTNETLASHQIFLHKLSRRRTRDSRLKLFTTNYDTCFEEAASKTGIVVIDGFSFTKPRHYDPRFFDFDIVRRTSNSQKIDSYLEGVFQLYKLHGSVNWEREKNVIIEKEATPEGVCMIFPARGKYQQSYIQPHLEIMARYLAALREPNTCIIVTGFGFNDAHLAEPIISAIKTNPHLKVIISDYNAKNNLIDKNTKCNPVWSELYQLAEEGSDVAFINASFKDFSKLIPDLSSLSPAEKMAQAVKSIVGDAE